MNQARGEIAGPTLTVIIPVFNEAATLEECLRQVVGTPYDKQILIVDDASTDGTPALLERLRAARPVVVLRHDGNRGKGAAIRTALPFATGRLTIIQDGDLELCPGDYPRLVEPLLTEEADCVIGSRFAGAANRSLSRLGVSVLNRCVRVLYGMRLTDEACCYKVLTTETLRRMNLQCERFEFCPEVVAKACRMGLRIKEVPVSYHPRRVADGKKLRYRDGIEAVRTLWRWRHWIPDRCKPQPLPEAGDAVVSVAGRHCSDEPFPIVSGARS
ncbi:MAG: glycosyltransferase family 2 protein [Planctomycetaceae bacterium]